MDAAQIPAKFPIPFAGAAGSSYIRPIPTLSQIGIVAGAASLTTGFVPLNFTAELQGGIPKDGRDENGILYQITAWLQWMNAGAPVGYDATFSAAIGGYPKGAILSSATNGGTWLSTVDNNVTDPDTGGAGWLAQSLGRLVDLQVITTAGSSTITAATAATNYIFIVQGGGGGGGGTAVTSGSQSAAGPGGGSGSFAVARYPVSSFSGGVIPVSVGAGGTGPSGAAGNAGAASQIGVGGAFVNCPGGAGGALGTATAVGQVGVVPGTGGGSVTGSGTGGSILFSTGGRQGVNALVLSAGIQMSGPGASSAFGAGGGNTVSGTGGAAIGYGSGGGGAAAPQSEASTFGGGNGAPGIIIAMGFS